MLEANLEEPMIREHSIGNNTFYNGFSKDIIESGKLNDSYL
jgi:hypothetical protein